MMIQMPVVRDGAALPCVVRECTDQRVCAVARMIESIEDYSPEYMPAPCDAISMTAFRAARDGDNPHALFHVDYDDLPADRLFAMDANARASLERAAAFCRKPVIQPAYIRESGAMDAHMLSLAPSAQYRAHCAEAYAIDIGRKPEVGRWSDTGRLCDPDYMREILSTLEFTTIVTPRTQYFIGGAAATRDDVIRAVQDDMGARTICVADMHLVTYGPFKDITEDIYRTWCVADAVLARHCADDCADAVRAVMHCAMTNPRNRAWKCTAPRAYGDAYCARHGAMVASM